MLPLPANFKTFLDQHFQLIESYANDRVHVYSSADIRVRIVHDRNGRLFMDVSIKENPAHNADDWIIFSDLRSYMLKNDDYLEYTDFDKVSMFFLESYKDVISLLSANYNNVGKALEERGMHRAQVKFGGNPKVEVYKPKPLEENQQQKKKPWWKF